MIIWVIEDWTKKLEEYVLMSTFITHNRLMCMLNIMIDCVRYCYGRIILFNISSLYIFYMIMWKDLCYQIWNFGFKYLEWIQVFTIKIFHPEANIGNVRGFWIRLAQVVEYSWFILSPFKKFSVCWEIVCDYTELEDVSVKGGDSEAADSDEVDSFD